MFSGVCSGAVMFTMVYEGGLGSRVVEEVREKQSCPSQVDEGF